MFALNMTVIALELTHDDPNYEDIAIQTYEQFLAICNALAGYATGGVPLWDAALAFSRISSLPRMAPIIASTFIRWSASSRCSRRRSSIRDCSAGRRASATGSALTREASFRGHYVCACPEWENERGEHLLSVVDHTMLQPMLTRLLDEEQFLSPFGVRSVSKIHQTHRDLGVLPGVGAAMIEYVPVNQIRASSAAIRTGAGRYGCL